MVDTEQTIFGLLATAQEHQNLIEDAFKALEREREHLQLERQALKRAVAELETATQGIPSLIQESAKAALSGAVSATSEEMKGVFVKTGSVLRGDLEKVREVAQDSVNVLEKGWKWVGVAYGGAVVVFIAGLVLGWS